MRIKSFNNRRKILRNCGKHFVNLIERKNGQRNVEKRLNGQHEMEKVQENLGGVFFCDVFGTLFLLNHGIYNDIPMKSHEIIILGNGL